MSENMKIKYTNFHRQFEPLREEIMTRISEIFERGDFVLGETLKEFEKNFASYCQTDYAIGVANGTDAIILALKSLDIGLGDEVITAPNSFLATAGAIVAVGATPVFVDVKEDFNIDPDLIDAAITSKTKAIIPIHLTGRPAEMNKIMEIAFNRKLHVIEDAAQAVGARYHGKRVGSFGIMGCFSLHPLKNLNAAGDAGVITTSNKGVYEKIIKLRNHGLRNRNECEQWGYNSRLDCIQAAVVNTKLRYLEGWNEKIRKIAATYAQNLAGVVKVPQEREHEHSVYHTFIILHEQRDSLQRYLLEQGIETKIHYPIPLHLQPAAQGLGYKEGDFPCCERQAKRILSIPIYPELTDEEVKHVIDAVKAFVKNNG